MITALERIVRKMKNENLPFTSWLINSYVFWIIFTLCLLVSANGFTFDGDVRVDDDSPGGRAYPAIALDKKGNIYVVWQDDREGMWNWTVYCAKSTNGGETFGPNVRVGSSSLWFERYAPSIAVDDSGNIYVAWYDEGWGMWGEDFDIYLAKSTDDGDSFSPRVRVDHGDTSSAARPALAIDENGIVYIAWEDNREVNYHVYVNRSTDGGETFFPIDVRVDVFSRPSVNPSLEVDGRGIVYISWTYVSEDGNRIHINKSTDGWYNFDSSPVQVDDGSKDSYSSQLAMDTNNNLYMLWFAGWIPDWTNVYLDKSTDGGASFGPNVRANDVDSTAYWPSLAVDGKGTIFSAWHDTRNEYVDIYFSMSPDGGLTFIEDMRVDHQEWSSGYPSIAADDSGNVYFAWDQTTQFYGVPDAIYFTKSNVFTTCGQKGDINLDGIVNILDVVKAVNIILETLHATGYQEWAADFDRDGIVNIMDVVLIVNNILNDGLNRTQ